MVRTLLIAVLWLAAHLAAAADPISFRGPDETVYRVIKVLGEGSAAIVYQVEKITPGKEPEVIALKVYRAANGPTRDRTAESRLLSVLRAGEHPHLLPTGVVQKLTASSGSGRPTIVNARTMALADGSIADADFRERLAALGQPTAPLAATAKALSLAVSLSDQMSQAVGELFGLDLVHRDVKPGNFMYLKRPGEPVPFQLVLTDFDLVRERDSPAIADGSPAYVPPELYGDPDRLRAVEAHDVFSLGCSVYEMMFGEPPILDYFALAFQPPKIANAPTLMRMALPEEHEKLIQFVRGRFDDLIRRVKGDSVAAADVRRLRALVLAALTADPDKRMRNIQIAFPRSPLVRNLPSLRLFGKLKCWALSALGRSF